MEKFTGLTSSGVCRLEVIRERQDIFAYEVNI
jgi:hypothetical protein